MGADALVREARRSKDDALDLAQQAADQLLLLLGVFVRVSEEHAEIGTLGFVLRGPDERREERIGDIGHDEREVSMPPGAERAGAAVRHVSELLGNRLDAAERSPA